MGVLPEVPFSAPARFATWCWMQLGNVLPLLHRRPFQKAWEKGAEIQGSRDTLAGADPFATAKSRRGKVTTPPIFVFIGAATGEKHLHKPR